LDINRIRHLLKAFSFQEKNIIISKRILHTIVSLISKITWFYGTVNSFTADNLLKKIAIYKENTFHLFINAYLHVVLPGLYAYLYLLLHPTPAQIKDTLKTLFSTQKTVVRLCV